LVRRERAAYELALNRSELTALRSKQVRGVAISSTAIPVEEWLTEIRAEVQALADQANAAGDGLRNFL
jgi:hypothetical protein